MLEDLNAIFDCIGHSFESIQSVPGQMFYATEEIIIIPLFYSHRQYNPIWNTNNQQLC